MGDVAGKVDKITYQGVVNAFKDPGSCTPLDVMFKYTG